jgi:hypothetical protein
MWEGNPLGKPFDHHPTLLVAVSAAADAGAVTLLYRLPFIRNRPMLRRVALYGVSGLRVYLAVRNYDRIAQWKHHN